MSLGLLGTLTRFRTIFVAHLGNKLQVNSQSDINESGFENLGTWALRFFSFRFRIIFVAPLKNLGK
jgi:hypothetical protein